MDRWQGVVRPYSKKDVEKLQPSVIVEHTLARVGAERFWHLLNNNPFITALGALTGNQAVQQVAAGLRSIYLSGWQVAADANLAGQMYPDQSLYPCDSVPSMVKKINNSLLRADQVAKLQSNNSVTNWLAPIVADAEAGFGGTLNTFEIMTAMIEAGAAAVHFEDQLASEKKCGHMGGKVLIPTSEFIKKLISARLAADVAGVETIIIARTDARDASLVTSNIDSEDSKFIPEYDNRTVEGFYRTESGIDQCIRRALRYAPYADMLWFETSKPDLEEAQQFAKAIHTVYPGKLLAYNCSPSFNWQKHLSPEEMYTFNEDLGNLGFKFQFVTLAGFHALNASMFELARQFMQSGMYAYSDFQQSEMDLEKNGYGAVKHQSFVGGGYFDAIQDIVSSGNTSTQALKGSTEDQFENIESLEKGHLDSQHQSKL